MPLKVQGDRIPGHFRVISFSERPLALYSPTYDALKCFENVCVSEPYMLLFLCNKMIRRVCLKNESQTSKTKKMTAVQGFLTEGIRLGPSMG